MPWPSDLQRVVLATGTAAFTPRLETLRLSATGLETRGPGPPMGCLDSGVVHGGPRSSPPCPFFSSRLWRSVRATVAPVPDISAELWLQTLQRCPSWPACRCRAGKSCARSVPALFLDHKRFHGAYGREATDAMPSTFHGAGLPALLHLGDAAKALDWYDDFVTIVHPGEAVARRQMVTRRAWCNEHAQVLLGEAMERGPVMLSWRHIANAHENTARATTWWCMNLCTSWTCAAADANGCPLASGASWHRTGRGAYEAWWNAGAFCQDFRERVILAERLALKALATDAYGATSQPIFCRGLRGLL